MSDETLAELFPGFETRRIDTGETEIFLRCGGSGPPLLLLHGFPQTHAMWHKVAPRLAERFFLVIPDLRGYGQSATPPSDPEHLAYSKRTMGQDMVRVMAELGHEAFRLAGHDRGGRVAYRMALDHPERIERLAVLDIVPTHTMWTTMAKDLAMRVYHWLFLAQPEPFPERLIGGDPDLYLEHSMASWTAKRSLADFDPAAMAAYRAAFRQPERIRAACEDYRAGATCDLAHDEADVQALRRIGCPTLALWGAVGIAEKAKGPFEVWQTWAEDLEGVAVDCGHFVCEERPDDTASALLDFFKD